MKIDLSALAQGPLAPVVDFYNNQGTKIKAIMGIVICLVFVLVSLFVSVFPLTSKIKTVKADIIAAEKEQDELANLGRNRGAIEKRWEEKKGYLEYLEKQFLTTSETSSLLESISRVALDSGLKIQTLRPANAAGLIMTAEYKVLPIRLTAEASTHQIGAFLASLESGLAVFKIRDLKIAGGKADDRKHEMEVLVEAYRKVY